MRRALSKSDKNPLCFAFPSPTSMPLEVGTTYAQRDFVWKSISKYQSWNLCYRHLSLYLETSAIN